MNTRRARIAAIALGAGIAIMPTSAYATSTTHFMIGANYQGGWAAIAAHGSRASAVGELIAVQHFSARVSCLEVSGNDGIATARITASQDPTYPVGEVIVAEAVDDGGGPADEWRISFDNNGGIYQESPGCYLPFYAPVPIERGHVAVR